MHLYMMVCHLNQHHHTTQSCYPNPDWANQFLPYPHNAEHLARKWQVSILKSLVWLDQCSNPRTLDSKLRSSDSLISQKGGTLLIWNTHPDNSTQRTRHSYMYIHITHTTHASHSHTAHTNTHPIYTAHNPTVTSMHHPHTHSSCHASPPHTSHMPAKWSLTHHYYCIIHIPHHLTRRDGHMSWASFSRFARSWNSHPWVRTLVKSNP